MKKLSLFCIILIILFSLSFCKIDPEEVEPSLLAAGAIAAESTYGSEAEETTSGTSTMNSDTTPNNVTTNDTIIFNGLISGTATVVHNVSWTEVGSGTRYNRTWNFSGTRTITFNNYSNYSTRTIQSGTVTVNITSGNLVSSTPTPLTPGNTVRRTATNVNKTLTGNNIIIIRRGNTYTCNINLNVYVTSRVINWKLDGSLNLTNPSLESRNVTITGTVTVNGKAYTINKTINYSSYED